MKINAKPPEEGVKRGPGRPKGSKDSRKIPLKPSPKDAKQDYKKYYGEVGLVAIYGVDNYTEELIHYMWKDPKQEFVVCDPTEQLVANLTRKIGNLPLSLYRYEAVHHSGFIESGMYPIVVVAKKYKDMVLKLPNPYGVEIICLEDY